MKILGQELEVERKRLPPMEDRIVSLESDLASQEDAVRLVDVSTVMCLVHVFTVLDICKYVVIIIDSLDLQRTICRCGSCISHALQAYDFYFFFCLGKLERFVISRMPLQQTSKSKRKRAILVF